MAQDSAGKCATSPTVHCDAARLRLLRKRLPDDLDLVNGVVGERGRQHPGERS
jgi:hypothetical protein